MLIYTQESGIYVKYLSEGKDGCNFDLKTRKYVIVTAMYTQMVRRHTHTRNGTVNLFSI